MSSQEIAKHLKAVGEYVAGLSTQRTDAQVRTAEMNRKMATVFEKAFTKAGIDTKEFDAVYLANSVQIKEDIKNLRQTEKLSAGETRPPAQRSKAPRRFAPMAAPFQVNVFTPPYDFAPNPQVSAPSPGSVATATNNVDGSLGYHLETSFDAIAPSNISANALVGVILFPAFGSVLSPFYGVATAQMSASFTMTGSAGCHFGGNAESNGSIGWVVAEVSGSTGEITQIVDETYDEQYDIFVNFGANSKVPVSSGAFTSQTTFLTTPENLYEVYVWFWGNIQATGGQGFFVSYSAGFGSTNVNSITLIWTPTLFGF